MFTVCGRLKKNNNNKLLLAISERMDFPIDLQFPKLFSVARQWRQKDTKCFTATYHLRKLSEGLTSFHCNPVCKYLFFENEPLWRSTETNYLDCMWTPFECAQIESTNRISCFDTLLNVILCFTVHSHKENLFPLRFTEGEMDHSNESYTFTAHTLSR